MAKMKDNAIVGNIGHFDNEIDMAGLAKTPGIKKINIKPQYDEWVFPDGHSVMILAEGRLLNLGCATGHPSFVMSASFTNQTLAQLELHANAEKYGKTVTMLPKKLDEEVARLHLNHIGVKLTKLSQEQADYIGVPVEGPSSRTSMGPKLVERGASSPRVSVGSRAPRLQPARHRGGSSRTRPFFCIFVFGVDNLAQRTDD